MITLFEVLFLDLEDLLFGWDHYGEEAYQRGRVEVVQPVDRVIECHRAEPVDEYLIQVRDCDHWACRTENEQD